MALSRNNSCICCTLYCYNVMLFECGILSHHFNIFVQHAHILGGVAVRIRRLGLFLGVQNLEFQYFLGGFQKNECVFG